MSDLTAIPPEPASPPAVDGGFAPAAAADIDAALVEDFKLILEPISRQSGFHFSVLDPAFHLVYETDKKHFCRQFAPGLCLGERGACVAQAWQEARAMLRDGQPFAIIRCGPMGLDKCLVPVRQGGEIRYLILGGPVVNGEEDPMAVVAKLIAAGVKLAVGSLYRDINQHLPVLKTEELEAIAQQVRGVANLIEKLSEARWQKNQLEKVAQIDALGGRLIEDVRLGAGRKNPLLAASQLAEKFTEMVNADACCFWKRDPKGRLVSVMVCGLARALASSFACLDPETSLTGKVLKTGRPHDVADIWHSEGALDPDLTGWLSGMGIRSLLCVPVPGAPEASGALSIYRKQSRCSTRQEMELAKVLGEHVWSAISKLELLRSSMAQAEITSMLNVGRESRELYDRIAARVRDWLGAVNCSLFFRKGPGAAFEIHGTTGIVSGSGTTYQAGEGLTGWVGLTGQSLRVFNCLDEAELAGIDPGLKWRQKVKEYESDELPVETLRSFLGSPIAVGDQVSGVIRVSITASCRSVFSPEDEELLSIIAKELGNAWKRFRLAEDVERIYLDKEAVLEDVRAVHEAVVRNSRKPPRAGEGDGRREIVRLAFEKIRRRRPSWEWVHLQVPDEARTKLVCFEVEGPHAEEFRDKVFVLQKGGSMGSDCFLGEAGEQMISNDIRADNRYKGVFIPRGSKSCMILLLSEGGRKIGVLTVESDRLDDFPPNEQEYLRFLAGQLSVAFALADSIQALRDADLEQRANLEAMAHQLVAPLSAIRGNCDVLLAGKIGHDRAKRLLESLSAQSKIAAATASNFGILADLLMGRTPGRTIQKVPRNVAKLAVEVVRNYQPMAWENEKRMFVNAPDTDLFQADYDERTFPQVLRNMVENAVKYSDDRTEILLALSKTGGIVRIEVSSKGLILSPQDVKKVFEHGYRTESARLKFPPGTGIGLPIARSIVEAHGGRMFAIATDDQRRTKFVVEIPASR